MGETLCGQGATSDTGSLSVQTAADEFWKAVDRWLRDGAPIGIDLVRAAQPEEHEKLTVTVTSAYKPTVYFECATNRKQLTIDFANAHISLAGFEIVEPFGMVRVFEVTWDGAEFFNCVLMEPRELNLGIPV